MLANNKSPPVKVIREFTPSLLTNYSKKNLEISIFSKYSLIGNEFGAHWIPKW